MIFRLVNKNGNIDNLRKQVSLAQENLFDVFDVDFFLKDYGHFSTSKLWKSNSLKTRNHFKLGIILTCICCGLMALISWKLFSTKTWFLHWFEIGFKSSWGFSRLVLMIGRLKSFMLGILFSDIRTTQWTGKLSSKEFKTVL